jgi:hypothetical protein
MKTSKVLGLTIAGLLLSSPIAAIGCSAPESTNGSRDSLSDSESDRPSGGNGADRGDPAESSVFDTPVGCNTVRQEGLPIKGAVNPDPAPIGKGGPLGDGTYVLTAITAFLSRGSAISAGVAMTLVVQGGRVGMKVTLDTSTGDSEDVTASFTPNAGGESSPFDVSCPEKAATLLGNTTSYTATTTELRLYGVGSSEYVFTKN